MVYTFGDVRSAIVDTDHIDAASRHVDMECALFMDGAFAQVAPLRPHGLWYCTRLASRARA